MIKKVKIRDLTKEQQKRYCDKKNGHCNGCPFCLKNFEGKDWRALCEMLETFLYESRKGWVSQKLFVFNKYIKEHPLPDKKTEAEYMAEDDKSIQNWVDLINQCPGEKKTIDDYNPATEEYLLSQGLNQRYAHYNWDYLYKIAKERHCSIDRLERIQGLCSFYVTGGNLCKNKAK